MISASINTQAHTRNSATKSNLATSRPFDYEWQPRVEDWNNLYLGKKVIDANEQQCGTAVDIMNFSDSASPENILVQYRTFLGFDKAMMVPVQNICKITASSIHLNICRRSIKNHGTLNSILRYKEELWESEEPTQLPFIL